MPIYAKTSFDDDKAIIIKSIKYLSEKYKLSKLSDKKTKVLLNELNRFKTIQEYPFITFTNAYSLEKNGYYSILFILCINSTTEIIGRYGPIKEDFSEFELFGLTTLKKNYGKTYLKPETLIDKINEFINPIEIDFDFDKEFSKKYYVVSNDAPKFKKSVTQNFLKTIKTYKGLEIELHDKHLLVRLRSKISINNAGKIAKFLSEINNGIN